MVAGPSGVGKGTVIAGLIAARPDIWLSVSATTRPPRPGEVDGVSYYFYDPEEFATLIRNEDMLEWAEYSGYLYGTPRRPVESRLESGVDVILELDVQGARLVREAMPGASLVFLAPPSWDELERRLRGRATEDPEALQRRLLTAKEELAAESEFDQVIVNADVGQAVSELVNLVSSPR